MCIEVPSVIGKNIRRYRILKSMTQEELGVAIYSCRSTVSLWERGEKEPSEDEIKRIAQVLGIDICDLLSEELSEKSGNNDDCPTMMIKIEESIGQIEGARQESSEAITYIIDQLQQVTQRNALRKKYQKEIICVILIGISILLAIFILYLMHVNKPDSRGNLREGSLVIEVSRESQ